MSSEAGLTAEERDFIAEVIAEDKQRRMPRNYVAAIAKPVFDEEVERAKFEAFYTERAKTLPLGLGVKPLRYSGGQYINDYALFGWMVWLACAKSREESK